MINKNDKKYNAVLKLSSIEKLQCLKEINKKLKKILYVYEKSLEPESKYNYKIYCSGLFIFISSSNILFNGELVSLLININSILNNDFEKSEIKRLVFESVNFVNHMTGVYSNLIFLKNGDFENGIDKHN